MLQVISVRKSYSYVQGVLPLLSVVDNSGLNGLSELISSDRAQIGPYQLCALLSPLAADLHFSALESHISSM
jgi:hypothetical protein